MVSIPPVWSNSHHFVCKFLLNATLLRRATKPNPPIWSDNHHSVCKLLLKPTRRVTAFELTICHRKNFFCTFIWHRRNSQNHWNKLCHNTVTSHSPKLQFVLRYAFALNDQSRQSYHPARVKQLPLYPFDDDVYSASVRHYPLLPTCSGSPICFPSRRCLVLRREWTGCGQFWRISWLNPTKWFSEMSQ